MEKIAKFSKVSLAQFAKDWQNLFSTQENIKEIYDNIKLPQRATIGSAGYDFYAPMAVKLMPKESIFIPTGVRVEIKEGWLLALFPRSGLGIKHRLQLDNTAGIIDSDYYYAQNEGHIMAKITNDTNEEKILEIKAGQGFMQGIFLSYGICVDDETNELRMGGFGSTDQKK